MKFQKKLEFQKKFHIKFQKNGGKKIEFQKKSYEIPNSEGKIGICRFFLNWSGFDPIF